MPHTFVIAGLTRKLRMTMLRIPAASGHSPTEKLHACKASPTIWRKAGMAFTMPALAVLQMTDKPIHPLNRSGDILHTGGITAAHKALAPRAKGAARNHRNLLRP